MYDKVANEGKFLFVIDIKCLREDSMSKNSSIQSVSVSWIDTLCFFCAYEEGRKGKDDEFSCETDDEDICILVCFLWYSDALIASVTYILCLFCWIIEITTQKTMNIISHIMPQKVCQPPHPKKWSSW